MVVTLNASAVELLATLTFMVPLLTGVFLFRLDGRRSDAVMLSSLATVLVSQLGVLSLRWRGGLLHYVYMREGGLGEAYGIIVDPMSVLIGTVVAVAGFVFMLYAVEYMGPLNTGHPVRRGKGRFHAWMVLFEGATMGFVYSSTFLGMLVFFEIMGLACWGVVSYYGNREGYRAGFKAFIVPNIGAMVGFYTVVGIGITRLHDLSLFSIHSLDPSLRAWVFVALLIAGYTKSAQFPFYSWIPDAMEAPTPASAFLHGAAMVEMGVYLVARVLQFIGPLPRWTFYVMAVMVSISILIPVINYPVQRDAKRLLAYSTVSEAGVMFVGLTYAALGLRTGLQAAMFQLTTHAFVKGLAFLTAGTFTYSLGTLDLRSIRGLGRLEAASWSIALLGLAGLPPMGMAFSKMTVLENLRHPGLPLLSILPALMVLMDSAVFLWVGMGWIGRNTRRSVKAPDTLCEDVEGRERVSITATAAKRPLPRLMASTLMVLIVLSLAVAYVSYPLVRQIGFYWGVPP